VQFLGAQDTVTGSKTLIRFHGKKWLIDCGLFQGPKAIRDRNWEDFEVNPTEIDGIILTHAHLDHSGYLPRICSQGYSGKIHVTTGTADLLHVLLKDSAKIEEEGARYAAKSQYSNHRSPLPLFTMRDAEQSLKQVISHKRNEWISLDENLSIRFLQAGHIIGASLVQLLFSLDSVTRIMTFSGDIGHSRSLTIREPEPLIESDVLVLESTYGDRLHPRENTQNDLAEIVNRTISRGGVLVIPAFAVGRAQEIIYMLKLLEKHNRIATVPIILDSPMANAATQVFLNHYEDQKLSAIFQHEEHPFEPELFKRLSSVDASMLACAADQPAIIISASGMLAGGRVLHHVKHRIENEKNTILFTGYQAEGTKGRFLQEAKENGETEVRIHHQAYQINAEICSLESLSSHGDYQDILKWMGGIKKMPKTIILNHGEIKVQKIFAKKIKEKFDVDVRLASEEKGFSFWR
jgi:metallo-beta-lactamase family protein